MRIMLGILPGAPEAIALTQSLISGGCASQCIFLMLGPEDSTSAVLRRGGLLASIGNHRGVSVYCVDNRQNDAESVFAPTVQQRRFAHLINRFAEHYPADWAIHRHHVRDGSAVGIVHLPVPIDEESAIARLVLGHSVTRVQISDFPVSPNTD